MATKILVKVGTLPTGSPLRLNDDSTTGEIVAYSVTVPDAVAWFAKVARYVAAFDRLPEVPDGR
jgi:hypothetical protein